MRTKGIFWLFLTTILLFIYWKPVVEAPILEYDDRVVIEPMRETHTLNEYRQGLDSGHILDRQPIRDLSYWLEFRFQAWTGWFHPQLINLILWLGILAAVASILRQL